MAAHKSVTAAVLPPITRRALFASFLKMGLLGFGGVLPWARRVIVDERRWLDDLVLGDREHATEALQREAVEGEEEVGERCRPRRRAARVGRVARGRCGVCVVAHEARRLARAAQTLSAMAAAIQPRPTRLSAP